MPIKERFVYFGSFYRSAEILEYIVNAGYMPAAIVCGPDRPAGRDRTLTPPAVKKIVLEKGWKVEVLQPEKVPDIIPRLKEIAADFFIVMGYAQIIPQSVLDLPRLGTIGVHPSLLPKYRGASPMQSALLAGETETGVTLYIMDNKMDHGPIIATQKFPIAEGENDISLGHKAARVAGELLVKTLPSFVAGSSAAREQDHTQATFTKKFTTADGQVDMQKDAPLTMYRKIKALNPEPSVWTMNFPGREGVRVKLLDATWVDEKLKITEIQPAGKKPFKV
jgi:methionyl-tRNA formyltransferase